MKIESTDWLAEGISPKRLDKIRNRAIKKATRYLNRVAIEKQKHPLFSCFICHGRPISRCTCKGKTYFECSTCKYVSKPARRIKTAIKNWNLGRL